MKKYTQITLDKWMQWKEDIRNKLAETAGNFVYIGYRLKQIRDSGMYDGAADIFEFAEKEYGLGKSTVSRFIAINEKYSEGGNSLELKEEFRNFSSSKLSEMLTLPDNEIQLITEKTTIREIRELKSFNAQTPGTAGETARTAEVSSEQERTPLEKCLIDFFKAGKEMLNGVMRHLEADPPEYKQAAEMMAPSGQASHRKGIVFLFLYDWNTGIKYKLMTEPEPVSMSWMELLNTVYHIFGACDKEDIWTSFYGEPETPKEELKKEEKEEAENTARAQSIQGKPDAVATSQQTEKQEKTTEKIEKKEADIQTEDKTDDKVFIPEKSTHNMTETSTDQTVEGQLPGQMELEKDFPELCPSKEESINPEPPAEPYIEESRSGQVVINFEGQQDFEKKLEEFRRSLDAAYKCAEVKEYGQASSYLEEAADLLVDMECVQEKQNGEA